MNFPRYPAYKPSGVEWLGEVPEHWETLRLRFAVTLNPSKQEAKELGEQELVSFLPMEAIGEDGSLRLENERELAECLSGYTYFRDGDVCVAKITPCFENGKGAILRELKSGIGFGTTELIVARPEKEKITSEFLDYLFRSQTFRRLGESEMYGAGGQKRVPDSFIRDFTAALPSIEEQNQATTFLDHETAKIDALIAEQQRLIELLQEKRQAVISHAVTKGLNPDAPMKDSGVEWLGEVPEHWEILKISKITHKITNGYVGPTRDILVEDGIPYIQATHIKRGRINFDSNYYVRAEWSAAHAKSVLMEGDVLIVQTGAGTGDAGLVSLEDEGFNCHALIILAPTKAMISGRFLLAVLLSSYGKQKLESIQTGGMHPHLNCGNVKFVDVPVPPISEQQAIVDFVASQTDSFEILSSDTRVLIGLLQERRSALISAAVTGQIDVRGLVPEDEAA